jgi:hypothetical protein
MGVDAVLHVNGQRVVGLPDPSGGTFDAAGDFDRLLPLSKGAYPVLSRIDPDGVADFGPPDMAAIVREVESALALTSTDRERRGLLRMKALAVYGSLTPGALLRVTGD